MKWVKLNISLKVSYWQQLKYSVTLWVKSEGNEKEYFVWLFEGCNFFVCSNIYGVSLPFPNRLLCETLIFPLQDKLDDWKKAVVQLDKDHSKGGCFFLNAVLSKHI